jgi:hypothetical protein
MPNLPKTRETEPFIPRIGERVVRPGSRSICESTT